MNNLKTRLISFILGTIALGLAYYLKKSKLSRIVAIPLVVVLVGISSFLYFNSIQENPVALATANTKIRQEINITDAYYFAASGSYATSSEIIAVTDNNYTAPAYYFEVVASTTSATNASVSLVNATSSAVVATVTVDQGNTYTRYRSSQFLPNASTTVEYKVKLNNESVGKGIIAARVIVLQNSGAGDLNTTETQIEIGCNETFTTSATTTCSDPKYWSYNASKWDSSTTTYFEVTYKTVNGVASSTSYSSAGTFTVVLPGGSASTTVELRGGGGAGDGTSANTVNGYGGGGGGAYAKSNLLATTSSHTLVVGAGGVGEATTDPAPGGADSTWDTTLVVADGGAGANTTTLGAGGTTANSTGQVEFNGGDGATGTATLSGGGGEGAGSTADGGDASGTTGGSGTDGGNGANGITVEGDGANGTAPGGGGSGAFLPDATNHTGGSGAVGSSTITSLIATSTIVLQVDDGSFGSWTDVANTYVVTSNTIGGGEETRVRSTAAFTLTNGRHYRLALRKNDSRTSIAIYNAKIIVNQTNAPTNSYSESNTSSSRVIQNTTPRNAQCFVAKGGNLSTSKFDLKKTGAPTGNSTSKIYAVSGTCGVDAIPTGAALATSGTLDVSTLTTSFVLTTFTFTGGNQIALTAGTSYFVSVEYTGGDASNRVDVGNDNTSPTDPGNAALETTGTWVVEASYDIVYYVIASGSAPTLIEPQYLLAPFQLPPGTALQKFLTYFDPAEWSTTNTYLLQGDAADNSTSDPILQDSTGATTYATLSNPDNSATTTLTCIPSAAENWDTKADTNGNDVFSVRVLVQVGGTQTSTCSAGPAATTPRAIIQGQTIIQTQLIIQ